MEDKIDLELILQEKGDPIHAMREAVNQTLILASKEACYQEKELIDFAMYFYYYSDPKMGMKGILEQWQIKRMIENKPIEVVDKQSILDVRNLVVG